MFISNPYPFSHVAYFIFQVSAGTVFVQTELVNDLFKIAAAQDLLGDGAEPLVNTGRHNRFNIAGGNPLGLDKD